jgi:hypothetical protein
MRLYCGIASSQQAGRQGGSTINEAGRQNWHHAERHEGTHACEAWQESDKQEHRPANKQGRQVHIFTKGQAGTQTSACLQEGTGRITGYDKQFALHPELSIVSCMYYF